MNYKINENDIILIQDDFNLGETLDCGQAFRWSAVDNNTYEGYYLDHYLMIVQNDNTFTFKNTSEADFLNIWTDYFDLNTDYAGLKKVFSTDQTLKSACDYAGGIRLLRQDAWETLCSFIISQNNNIPRIKGIISRLCEHYGHFPSAQELSGETEESLNYLRSGFRAKYIIDAAKKTADKSVDLSTIYDMDYEDGKKKLMEIKGVGPKVADCVLLFGIHKTQACPVDVWIKRVLAYFYPEGMPECVKGYDGIAQQYLFHYARKHSDLFENK
ncbi:MAG: DNA glycosylase [Oscillospiraceae bacterium]|nr:DNA glycosylase [Oscillospiraceae bacterium]